MLRFIYFFKHGFELNCISIMKQQFAFIDKKPQNRENLNSSRKGISQEINTKALRTAVMTDKNPSLLILDGCFI